MPFLTLGGAIGDGRPAQNWSRIIPCMRLGTFICVVTAPNAELVGFVFGAPKVTWLKTFRASIRTSIRIPSRTCTCLSKVASEEL